MPQILIIIPVYNEEASLPKVIAELSRMADMDLLVVDDASTDNSLGLCREHNVSVLPLKVRLGAWGATQTGMRYALKHDYDHVITMDGDGQHHSHELHKLLKVAQQNPSADVVIGECISRGSFLRHVAWRFFRLITGMGIEDITSGFRLYNRQAIALLSGKQATMLEYQDVGVLLMLKAAGMNIVETRVSTSPRLHGKSHLFSSWLKVTHYMVISTILAISKFGINGARK